MDFTLVQLAKESSPSSVVARPRNPGTRTPVASHGNEDRGEIRYWASCFFEVITDPDVGKKSIVVSAVWYL